MEEEGWVCSEWKEEGGEDEGEVDGMEEEEEAVSPLLVFLALVGGCNSWNSPLFGLDLKIL